MAKLALSCSCALCLDFLAYAAGFSMLLCHVLALCCRLGHVLACFGTLALSWPFPMSIPALPQAGCKGSVVQCRPFDLVVFPFWVPVFGHPKRWSPCSTPFGQPRGRGWFKAPNSFHVRTSSSGLRTSAFTMSRSPEFIGTHFFGACCQGMSGLEVFAN